MSYATIAIGSGASDYDSITAFFSYTFIDISSPSAGTGVLTSFDVWVNFILGTQTDFYWGCFYGSGTSYTNRSQSSNLSPVTVGSKQTFTGQNIAVTAGDFIGFYANYTLLEENHSNGSGVYYKSWNQFGAGAQTYTLENAAYKLALYATGMTAPDAPTSVSATDNLTDKVTITWTKVGGQNVTGYHVYRNATDLGLLGDVATYDDTGGTVGTTYPYTVKAVNPASLSAASTADNGTRVAAATSFIKGIMQTNYIPPYIGN